MRTKTKNKIIIIAGLLLLGSSFIFSTLKTPMALGAVNIQYTPTILPITDLTYELGTSTKKWLRVFTSGLVYSTTTTGCLQGGTTASGLVTTYFTGTNCGSGSVSGDHWATTTNLAGIYPSGGSSIGVMVGETSTSSLSIFEVNGTSSIIGKLQLAQPVNTALVIGEISGNTRGITSIDIQSERIDPSYVASGDYCTVIGLDSTCLANFGGTFGYSNYSGDVNAYAIGSGNHSNGTYSQTFGRSNTADAFDIAIGNTNSASGGTYAAAFGAINVSTGADTLTVGHTNQALSDATIAIGANNTANPYGSGIFGYSNTVKAAANGAFIFGGGLTATLASSTYIGQLASSSLTISGQTGSLSAQYFVSTSTTATSTGANGWNLTKGCFAINSVCVGSGTLTGSGNNLGVAYWNSVSSLADTKDLQWQNTTGRFAVGASSTPFGQVSITTTAGTSSLVIGSSTGTHLILDSTGNLGIGTSTPAGIVSINHTAGNNALMIGSSTNTSFAIDAYGHPVFGGTAPTLSSCGVGPRFYFGDDSGGIIIGGTGSQTSCTLTFSAQSNLTAMAPSCTIVMATSTAHTLSASTTPTTLVITSNRTLAAMATQYICTWHMK